MQKQVVIDGSETSAWWIVLIKGTAQIESERASPVVTEKQVVYMKGYTRHVGRVVDTIDVIKYSGELCWITVQGGSDSDVDVLVDGEKYELSDYPGNSVVDEVERIQNL